MSGINDVVQRLIGCCWGRDVSTPDDTEPCPLRAEKIVVVHNGPFEAELRLCAKHVEAVNEQTTPRPS